MATNIQYKAKIACKWVYGSKETDIETEAISSILLDYDYDNTNMPLIYITLNIKSTLYNQMIVHAEDDNSKIYLEIKNYNMNENNAIGVVDIKQQFTYFMPNSVNFDEDLIKDAAENNTTETAYNRTTIGLVYDGVLDKNRKNFPDNIYSEINKSTLVYLGLKHFKKLCINKITPTELPTMIMPPLTTVAQYLAYIDKLYPIYVYGYRFFNDFDCTYLLNERDVYVPNGSGDYKTVQINIDNTTDTDTATQGLDIDSKNKMYILNCDADSSTFEKDKKLAKQTSDIVGVNKKGETQELSISSDSERTTYVYTEDNSKRIKFNAMKYNTTVSVVKNLVNGRYFTPNKVYMVNNYKANSEYDGRYVLSRKQVVYQIQDGNFVPTTSLYLRLMVDFKSL
jgi:hypothetical protein